jgi:hypothetical protein
MRNEISEAAISIALKKIEDDALRLPARSRARLAERLTTSLEEAGEPHAEQAWLDGQKRGASAVKPP